MHRRRRVRSTTPITPSMRSVARHGAPRLASFAVVATLLSACGSDSSTSPTNGSTALAAVAVSPTTLNLHPGGSGTLTATALSASGATLTGKAFAWHSSNTSVANVSASGVVTAVAIGNAQITVTSEAYSADATVNVTPGGTPSIATQTLKSP